MRLIQFIITFCILAPLTLIIHHYGTLFFMKTEYVRDDFTDLTPLKSKFTSRMANSNKSVITIVLALAAIIIPYLLTATMHNWFINSTLLFAGLYYSRILMLSKAGENITTPPADVDLILLLFGFSLLSGFTLNWISFMNTGFIFFAVNFIATIILLYYTLNLFFLKPVQVDVVVDNESMKPKETIITSTVTDIESDADNKSDSVDKDSMS
ncbi:MAG: hypothetical protein PF637_14475 [Spirochaetes bacterium]|jgi:fumarate reductase subunit C|nr:hypothetical protein [Spirochaetota bacterium]